MTDVNIGENLRTIRARSALSLSATAELTGVSKAMLGQIERGESSPTVATLWKLAKGFRLPLTSFIENLSETVGRQTKANILPIKFDGSIGFHTLFPFDPLTGSETFLITLEPCQLHQSNAHDNGVVEDIFVVKGEMDVFHGGCWKHLSCGDALRFEADQAHGYRNLSDAPMEFHNTIYYPSFENSN